MSFIPVFDQAWIDRALDRIRSGKTLVISTIYNAHANRSSDLEEIREG